MYPFGETVVVLRAGTKLNPAGNDTLPDWAAASSTPQEGVAVAPGATFETPEPGRAALTADFSLYGPPDWEVTESDRITVRGAVCEVVGDPFSYTHPMTGWQPGTVVYVRKREH